MIKSELSEEQFSMTSHGQTNEHLGKTLRSVTIKNFYFSGADTTCQPISMLLDGIGFGFDVTHGKHPFITF